MVSEFSPLENASGAGVQVQLLDAKQIAPVSARRKVNIRAISVGSSPTGFDSSIHQNASPDEDDAKLEALWNEPDIDFTPLLPIIPKTGIELEIEADIPNHLTKPVYFLFGISGEGGDASRSISGNIIRIL